MPSCRAWERNWTLHLIASTGQDNSTPFCLLSNFPSLHWLKGFPSWKEPGHSSLRATALTLIKRDIARICSVCLRKKCTHVPVHCQCNSEIPIVCRLALGYRYYYIQAYVTQFTVGIDIAHVQSIGLDTTGQYKRVRVWLVGQLNAFGWDRGASSRSPKALPAGISPWQKGCPELIPGTSHAHPNQV